MTRFFVQYGDHDEWFACLADDAAHAAEQCLDFAPPGSDVHGVWRAEQDDSWERPRTPDFSVGSTVLGAAGSKASNQAAVVRGYGHCQLSGCNSRTLHLRWPDGRITRPCTAALVYDHNRRCWRIG